VDIKKLACGQVEVTYRFGERVRI